MNNNCHECHLPQHQCICKPPSPNDMEAADNGFERAFGANGDTVCQGCVTDGKEPHDWYCKSDSLRPKLPIVDALIGTPTLLRIKERLEYRLSLVNDKLSSNGWRQPVRLGEGYSVYFNGEFVCSLDHEIARVKSDWEIVRGIVEPTPLTPEGECKAFEIIVSEKAGFMSVSFEREPGMQIYKNPLVQAAWEGWQFRSQTSGKRLCR